MRCLCWLFPFLRSCRKGRPERLAVVPSTIDPKQWRIPLDMKYTLAAAAVIAAPNYTISAVNAEGDAIAAAFDAPPTASSSTGKVGVVVDGNSVTVTPVATGADIVTIAGTIAGVAYTATATFVVVDDAVAGIALLPVATPAA